MCCDVALVVEVVEGGGGGGVHDNHCHRLLSRFGRWQLQFEEKDEKVETRKRGLKSLVNLRVTSE